MPIDTIPARMQSQASRRPSAPAYHYKVDGSWKCVSWGDYGAQVRQAGRAMIQLGLSVGHTVGILGFNRPEWCVFDIAAMSVGAAPAGIYTTNSPEEVAYIVSHAETRLLLVENEDQWQKVAGQLDALPSLHRVITMEGTPHIDHEKVLSWNEFMALGDETDDSAFDARLEALRGDQLATLIYTSGTTGPPKGVMLSHDNLAWTSEQIPQVFNLSHEHVTLSYLPLSHIAEQMFSVHGPLTMGYQVYFAESIDKLPDNLKEAKPTVFFGVPRIWEKFYAALSGKMSQATGVKKKLVAFAMGAGEDMSRCKMTGQAPGPLLSLRYAIAHKLVLSKVKAALGLENARWLVSGAAPVSADILRFFSKLDMVVFEVYGQSEDCGPTTINRPGATRLGSVGQNFPGVDVRIAADGEILARGRNVFQGYFKDAAATAEALDDEGWLHSGDLGSLDDAGFLTITGRKKDIIITAGGKNIAPKNIEAALKDLPLVAEAVVIGDRRKFLSALICLDDGAADAFCGPKGIDPSQAATNAQVRAEVQAGVDTVNARFAQVEHIRNFAILPRMLTMEDHELTPTLKVKRQNVNDNWADTIEAMYADAG